MKTITLVILVAIISFSIALTGVSAFLHNYTDIDNESITVSRMDYPSAFTRYTIWFETGMEYVIQFRLFGPSVYVVAWPDTGLYSMTKFGSSDECNLYRDISGSILLHDKNGIFHFDVPQEKVQPCINEANALVLKSRFRFASIINTVKQERKEK